MRQSYFHPIALLITIFVAKIYLDYERQSPLLTFKKMQNEIKMRILQQKSNLSQLSYLLLQNEIQFIGEWNSNQNQDNFDYLSEKKGYVAAIFIEDDYKKIVNSTLMLFYNPQYYDEKLVLVFLNLTDNFDNKTMFSSNNSYVEYELQNHLTKQQDFMQCNANYTMNFSNRENPTQQLQNVKQINYTLQMNNVFDNCSKYNFNSSFVVNEQNETLSSILYCLFVSSICGIQLFSVIKLIKYFQDRDVESNKLSLLTIGFCTIFDAYLCLANLYLALWETSQLQYYLIPAFLFFVLSTIFEMRLLVIVWRARYYSQYENLADIRRGIAVFYLKFYLSLFIFLVLMYYFYIYNWFAIWISLFIFPQIVHNAIRGNNPKFYPFYIFGVLFSRIILPLYFRGCPENIRDYAPSESFCIAFSSIMVFSILILYLQYKINPRFFIPKCFLPQQYNYFINYEYNSESMTETDDCAICIHPLHLDPNSNQDNLIVNKEKEKSSIEDSEISNASNAVNNIQDIQLTKQKANVPLIKKQKIMRTPCGHRYHIGCLQSWIEIKMECPTCRQVLPPI